MAKPRLRDLGISMGRMRPGSMNTITDVPGVAVGQTSVISDTPHVVRSGVTAIVPVAGHAWDKPVFAAVHSFNGYGEVTGALWIEEAGLLECPILITATQSIGAAHEAATKHAIRTLGDDDLTMPVVAETYDGWLSEFAAFAVREDEVFTALDTASTGPVDEGNSGGGTGMICHNFKGGTGTASRLVPFDGRDYTIGAMVQANYGDRADLMLDGVPVGQALGSSEVPLCRTRGDQDGSIIIVIATDAPMLPVQLKRLARRATVGLARVGGYGHNGSGDIFLAFSTGNRIESGGTAPVGDLSMIPQRAIDPFFHAVGEAVEEAIWNALVGAETMTGRMGRVATAIPHEALVETVRRYRPDLVQPT